MFWSHCNILACPEISIPVQHQILAHLVLQLLWKNYWHPGSPPLWLHQYNINKTIVNKKELETGVSSWIFPCFPFSKQSINRKFFYMIYLIILLLVLTFLIYLVYQPYHNFVKLSVSLAVSRSIFHFLPRPGLSCTSHKFI